MRKPLMVIAAAALSVASVAGCRFDVSPVDDPPANEKTSIAGNARTEFDATPTRLGLYRSLGALSNGNNQSDACTWKLLFNEDSDTALEEQDRGDTIVVADNGVVGDNNDQDEVQEFELTAESQVLEAKGCKNFVRVDGDA